MKAKTNKSKLTLFRRTASHHVKMALIPHKKNDYRPHLVRRYGLVAVIIFVVGIQFGYNFSKTGDVLGKETDVTISSLFKYTNDERVKAGKNQFNLDEKLNRAAYFKAKDMFADQYWDHVAPDGTQPWKWLADADYDYNMAGENLAKNYSTTAAVMAAWMGSSEHKKNILKDDYADVGFAVVDGEMNGRATTLIVAFYALSAEAVANQNNAILVNSAVSGGTNIFNQFAVALRSITPAVSIGLMIICLAILVALVAHKYRHQMPKKYKKSSLHLHHGLLKAIGLGVFSLVMIFIYNSGQI